MTYTVTYLDIATNSIMHKTFKNIKNACEWVKDNKEITPFKIIRNDDQFTTMVDFKNYKKGARYSTWEIVKEI